MLEAELGLRNEMYQSMMKEFITVKKALRDCQQDSMEWKAMFDAWTTQLVPGNDFIKQNE
jgi:hypothetical protein